MGVGAQRAARAACWGVQVGYWAACWGAAVEVETRLAEAEEPQCQLQAEEGSR